MNEKERQLRIKVIMKLAVAWHSYGVSAFRMESTMGSLAKSLGLNGQFFFTPTYIAASFEFPDGEISRIKRIFQWEVNLNKMCLLDELAGKIMAEEIPLEQALGEIDRIVESKNIHRPWFSIPAYGTTSMGIALLWNASFSTALITFVLGSLLGLLSHFSIKSPRFNDVSFVVGPFLVASLAGLLHMFDKGLNVSLLSTSGVIVLLPGLALTVAMAELATNHLASGTARLMGSLVTLFKIGLGMALGYQFVSHMFGIDDLPISGSQFPLWEQLWRGNMKFIFALAIMPLSTAALFQTRWKDVWIPYAVGLSAVIISSLPGLHSSAELRALLGGAVVGVASNLIARVFNRPSSLGVLPGLILLVPGSLGYRSLDFLFKHELLSGLGAAFTTLSVAMSLVAGLFFGNIILNPRNNV